MIRKRNSDMERKENLNRDTDTTLKLHFYIMSLWLLFVLLFLLTVDIPISFSKDAHFIGVMPLLKRNWFAFISLLLALLGIIFASMERRKWAGVSNPPYEILSVKNENYEYLTFLTTYIIPLICIDLTKVRYVIVLGVLLVLIGFIFIRMDLYSYTMETRHLLSWVIDYIVRR